MVFWATMSTAGLAVEYLFAVLHVPAPARHTGAASAGVSWNVTTWLNIAALIVFAALYWLYKTRTDTDTTYAKDPVCGMQVEIAHAPAHRTTDGVVTYFCSDHCADRFDKTPTRYLTTTTPAPHEGDHMHEHTSTTGTEPTAIDPICGMTVDPATTPFTAEHDHQAFYFCSAGCQKAFTMNPHAFLTADSHDA